MGVEVALYHLHRFRATVKCILKQKAGWETMAPAGVADPTARTGQVERSLEHLVTPKNKKTLKKNKYRGGCHTHTS